MAFEEILNVALEVGVQNVVLEKAVTNLQLTVAPAQSDDC